MKVNFRIFRTSSRTWEDLFQEAAEFASTFNDGRLINISHSCDSSDSVVTVWYWGK